MKYNQPFGVSDPDAAYVNGNPSTGTMGSIPPAASMEYDQREIVSVIQWAYDNGYYDQNSQLCAAPSNSDLSQLLKAIFGISNSRLLTEPRDYYVDSVAGSDANDGLSSDNAFATLQAAQNALSRFNLNGFNITVHVAPGTYAKLNCGSVSGSGTVSYIGNTTTPSLCTISGAGTGILCSGSGSYWFSGFKITTSGTIPGTTCAGAYAHGDGAINLSYVEFGSCTDCHMFAQAGGYIAVQPGTIKISGSCGISHAYLQSGGKILHATLTSPILTISASVSMPYFVLCTGASYSSFIYGSITGAGSFTGQKYSVVQNSIVETYGAGVNYLPGTIAGATGSGGQYT